MDVVLLDFEEAFDNMAYSRLLYELEYKGVRGMVLNWVRAFCMSNRKQQVELEGSRSEEADVLSGVQQGTVLGLFYS